LSNLYYLDVYDFERPGQTYRLKLRAEKLDM
jgi:hypothetical protein